MITIQGLDYNVELTPPGLHSNFIGQTIPEDLQIMVSAGIAPQKQEEVMIHEITHMLVYNEPIVMSQSHEESEGFVSRLAVALYQMLNENDLLVDGWMEQLVDGRPEEVVAISSNKNVTEHNVDNNPLRTVDGPEEDPVSRPIRNERARWHTGRNASRANVETRSRRNRRHG